MYKGGKPRIIPIIIAIVVVALVVAALVSLGRILFSGGTSNTTTTSQSSSIQSDLLDTSSGRGVSFIERGPIVANESFKSYQIVVTPTTRTYTTYRGYQNDVVTFKTYPNSQAAYEQFVYALDKAYAYRVQGSASDTDTRGVCATNGRLYTFETNNNGAATHTLWTSTCKGSPGNMGANIAQIKALFVNQIPDFQPNYIDTKTQTITTPLQ